MSAPVQLLMSYKKTSSALLTGIYAYWKFDSSNSNDSVGSNNGTDTSITYSSGNGKINNGAGFNGSTSKIVLPDVAFGIASASTFAFWIKTTSTVATNPQMFTRDHTGVLRAWQVGMGAGTTNKGIRFIRFDSGGSLVTNITSAAAINDGSWHHVVCTFDNTVGSIVYIDGLSSASDAVTTNTNNNTGEGVYIGNYGGGGGSEFPGSLDEIGVWTRALSSSEVTQLYNSGSGLQYPF